MFGSEVDLDMTMDVQMENREQVFETHSWSKCSRYTSMSGEKSREGNCTHLILFNYANNC